MYMTDSIPLQNTRYLIIRAIFRQRYLKLCYITIIGLVTAVDIICDLDKEDGEKEMYLIKMDELCNIN